VPAHSETAGSIILEEAYALSKMIESKSWNGLLRSGITPSDIDFPPVPLVFDNDGAIIFCDFSNNCDDWNRLAITLKGQRWLYESLIRCGHPISGGNGPHCAVLCRHSVAPEMDRKIDSLHAKTSSHDLRDYDACCVLAAIVPDCWAMITIDFPLTTERMTMTDRRN
jgi:hypothetical protein